MRTMAVWIGAVLMAGGLWSASGISQGLADEPAAPSSSSEATGGAAGNETGGSDAVPPVVEGEKAPPPEAGDVQERAVRRDQLEQQGTSYPSQKTRPPAGQPAPKVLVPGMLPPPEAAPRPGTSIDQPDRGVAPTVNLSQVAYAMTVRAKSLTTLVTAPPGLAVTQPVEISIGYYSPAGMYPTGFQRITQSYVRGTGNRFLNNDPEGEGKPRRVRMDISLREPNPGGGFYTFAFSLEQDLDPLYDVSVSPLQFSLIDNCDIAGNSEIRFVWWAPDDPSQNPHTFSFTTRVGRSTTINPFAWAHAEVSARNNLRQLLFYFWEKDDFHPTSGFLSPAGDTVNNLVPGKTKVIKGNLTDSASSNKADCRAYFEYTITDVLRLYPYL